MLLLLSAIFGRTGDLIFHSIESYFSSYRQSIETRDVTVREGIISVKITARRTNIKSQQLLGFYSVGRALQRTSISFREVHIIIHYQLRGGQKILMIAPVQLVLKLSQGKLSSDHFFDIISI